MDILLLQEIRSDGSEKELKKWGKIFNTNQIFFTEYGPESVGAGILIRNNGKFRVDNVIKDPMGRFVAIIVDHEEGRFFIGSFYSPSQSNDIKQFIEIYVIRMLSSLDENNNLPEFIILGGDTNTAFSLKDKQGGLSNLKQGALNAFLALQERFNLQDILRVKHPDALKFSWERTNPSVIKERIDVLFTSSNLQDFITETDIIPRYKTCSDHGIPYIQLKGFGIPTRGPGTWKFNNALLEETDFIYEMNNNLPNWIADAKAETEQSLGSQWGYIKHKIGEFSRKFGSKLKKERMEIKNKIESELESLSLHLNDSNKEKYDNLRQQLNSLIEYEVRGSIIRSLSQNYEEGEKCTKYFFFLEKHKGKQKDNMQIKTGQWN